MIVELKNCEESDWSPGGRTILVLHSELDGLMYDGKVESYSNFEHAAWHGTLCGTKRAINILSTLTPLPSTWQIITIAHSHLAARNRYSVLRAAPSLCAHLIIGCLFMLL